MKLEVNHKKNSGKTKNTCRLNNMLLHSQWVNHEIKEEIKNYMETNNENTTVQNIWDTAKPVLRGKFIAIQAYPKKQEKSQTTYPYT